MRIVIDSNIWVSGLLWRGMSWNLLRLAEKGVVELCVTPSMLAELSEVLNYRRLQPRLKQLGLTPLELVSYAMSLTTVLEVPLAKTQPIVVADRDDDVFLQCALAAQATYLVSGDHHLLNLGRYAGVSILTIRDLLVQEFPDQVID